MNILFTCAGTGGHVTPALAIAKKIKKENACANILFIGTKTGIENDMIKKEGFDIRHIRTDKIIRKFTYKNILSLYTNYLGYLDSKKIINEFKPDLVIGTGGYICVPVMSACKSKKVKYILHESNAFPGMAVKLISKNAQCVLIGFEEAKARIKKAKKIIYTGTPIKLKRNEYEKLEKDECKKEFSLDINKKIIVVSGGSQGAKKLNETIINVIKKYNNDKICYFVVTGRKNYDNMISSIRENNLENNKNIIVKDFIFEMEKLYKCADLVITRSGALTVTELEMTKMPSILIPFPYASENHQVYNANVLKDAGGALVILEKELSEDKLYSSIMSVIEDEEKLNKMSICTGKKYEKEAVDEIYLCIKDILKV